MNLLLDANAQLILGALLDEFENEEGWFKMMTRYAAQVDSTLKASHYVGTVTWYSEEDYIEHTIDYTSDDEKA
jgi:hypothetical protein